ncbi:MAG: hypothetical protein ACJAX4_003443 [Clostridium sp.]|jgi:hypothetical protein
MVNKIIASLSINKATFFYKFFKIGFKFHNGQGVPFKEI